MMTSVLSFSNGAGVQAQRKVVDIDAILAVGREIVFEPMPPRVPRGSGSSLFWLAAMEYFTFATWPAGSPIASFATCRAAVMY